MNFTKALLLSILSIFFFSCSDKSFFDFDEIEHYNRNIPSEYLVKVLQEEESKNNKKFEDILVYNYPKKLDEDYTKLLIENGYVKKILGSDKYEEIDKIFSKNTCLMETTSACVPIYRDIFIFKKNKRIIGIAKICFECHKNHIVGSNIETKNFGECGDYEKLENIIK